MWDLTNMTEESLRTLGFLLLLPVGVLITAVFNGVLGFRTIGIFTPTILALNQAKSDWRIGVIIFVVVFTVGSVGRRLLVRAKLSTITRRGIIATVTVMLFAVMVVISENMQLGLKAGSVVLPVAILTLMIDRFFNIIAKEGNRIALLILGNTVLVTVCCIIVFVYTPVRSIFLKYPWLELAVLCGLIYLGSKIRKPFFSLPEVASRSSKKPKKDD